MITRTEVVRQRTMLTATCSVIDAWTRNMNRDTLE